MKEEIHCPYCNQDIYNQVRYVREAPPDKNRELETMVKLIPCNHGFPMGVYAEYLESLMMKEEYIDEYVTAVGDMQREQVVEKYQKRMNEIKEIEDRCCAEVELNG